MSNQDIHEVLLIIADISGYTKFMVSDDVEVKHSQHIISELIHTIIRQVEIPLEVSKLEGDAVFLYAKKESDTFTWDYIRKTTGEKLIRFFDAFHNKLQELTTHRSCGCGACSNLHELSLKVVAHSGEALFYNIHDFKELSGKDVILVHRLLKNSINTDEYLLMTQQAYEDVEFPDLLATEEGKESYSHLGPVTTYVYKPESRLS